VPTSGGAVMERPVEAAAMSLQQEPGAEAHGWNRPRFTVSAVMLAITAVVALVSARTAPKETPTAYISLAGIAQDSLVVDLAEHAHPCSEVGEDCHCPGGFVLFGSFGEGQEAQYVVYPKRVETSLECSQDKLGNPSFAGAVTDSVVVHEECRCVPHGGVICEQESTPISNGCGAGASASLLNGAMSSEQVHCCDMHDLCYGTCNSTKETCDANFADCLHSTCSSPICNGKVGLMIEAVHTSVAAAAYGAAQAKREEWHMST